MDTKFTSNYTDIEQGKCVKQYFDGCDKEELVKRWGVSKRTIERWIKRYKDINGLSIRMVKRSKIISIHIQEEVMQILNSNAILYGFNISTWNETRVIKLLKQKYDIKITRYMSKLLLRDSKTFASKDEDKAFKEIIKLEELDCNLVILNFIRIGRIDRRIIEPLIPKKFNQHKLNVNLGIARGDEKVYIEIIFSDRYILEKPPNKFRLKKVGNIKNIKKEKEERKANIDNKANFIRKVIKCESNNIVFISKNDMYLKRFNKNNGKALFYIVDKDSHKQLVQDKYEQEQNKSIIQDIYNQNNEYRNFKSFEEIRTFINDKTKEYKGKVIIKIDSGENV